MDPQLVNAASSPLPTPTTARLSDGPPSGGLPNGYSGTNGYVNGNGYGYTNGDAKVMNGIENGVMPLTATGLGNGSYFNLTSWQSENPPPSAPIMEWDEETVHEFFSSIGLPQYLSQLKGVSFFVLLCMLDLTIFSSSEHSLDFIEHGISGDILVHLDHEGLRDVGLHSAGQRLAVLKAVYALKLRDDVPIEEGHYVPPCESWFLISSLSGMRVLQGLDFWWECIITCMLGIGLGHVGAEVA